MDLWRGAGVRVLTATDDGSASFHGTVTQAAEAIRISPEEFDFNCACGPRPMLKAVQEMMARHGGTGELCLEEFMACGVWRLRRLCLRESGPRLPPGLHRRAGLSPPGEVIFS